MELDWTAQENGWYGWSEGAGATDFVVYLCGCEEGHTTFVANAVDDDPEYYERRCAFIRQCKTT